MTHPQIKKPQFREKRSSWAPAAEPELEAQIPAPRATIDCWSLTPKRKQFPITIYLVLRASQAASMSA